MTLPDATELERRVHDLMVAWRVPATAVEVRWNERLQTAAGRAFVRSGRIELNPTLLGRAPDQLAMVLAHEAAHVAAVRLFGAGVPAHGRHWRSLMRLAGFEPKVTHDIPVAGRRRGARRRFVYLRVCDGCGDRRLYAAVRYGRCQGCDGRDRFLVLRASATANGQRALEAMTLDQVRAKCRPGTVGGDW